MLHNCDLLDQDKNLCMIVKIGFMSVINNVMIITLTPYSKVPLYFFLPKTFWLPWFINTNFNATEDQTDNQRKVIETLGHMWLPSKGLPYTCTVMGVDKIKYFFFLIVINYEKLPLDLVGMLVFCIVPQ